MIEIFVPKYLFLLLHYFADHLVILPKKSLCPKKCFSRQSYRQAMSSNRASARSLRSSAQRTSSPTRSSASRTSKSTRTVRRTRTTRSRSLSPTRSRDGKPTDSEIYQVARVAPNPFAGHLPRLSIYGSATAVEPKAVEFYEYEPWKVWQQLGDTPDTDYTVATDDGMGMMDTKVFKIAYSRWRRPDIDPASMPKVLINHGVPANQTQWYDIARLLAMVGFDVVVFDMLTMGWSTKPLLDRGPKMERLRWVYDVPYVDGLADEVFGKGTKFVYFADDWGTGIQQKYLEQHWDRVLWWADQDGIRGGAYPVAEIQAIGRASNLQSDLRPPVLAGEMPPDPGSFQAALGASDQTIVQILKTMAHQSDRRYNQWSLRDMKRPFYDVDYERPGAGTFNMFPKFFALKSMADRALAALRPGDLMNYDPVDNPGGIKFAEIEGIGLFYSGEYDRMMSANQRLRYPYWMPRAKIFTQLIPRADHFSGFDQPTWVATMLVAFHLGNFPPGTPGSIPVVFLGFDGIWKGTEEQEAAGYARRYGLKA